ncbi:MAG: response regulator [Vicinamibacterales bacterium]|nr:response regulator [Vicinamibacterales bacterium]
MKVLIVDDDSSSRTLLKNLVEEQGYPAAVAPDGRQGLETFRHLHPDIVFSDMRMPEMDGLELLEAIRQEDESAIFVLVTGFGCEEYAVQALRNGADDYIHKPIFDTDFVPLVKKLADRVKGRSSEREVRAMFAQRTLTLELDNTLDRVPIIAGQLLEETGGTIPRDERGGVRIGLIELLMNAIEHGNLGITYEQKEAALRRRDGLAELTGRRLAQPDLAARRVTVYFRMDAKTCEWVIADEGAGFDWLAVPEATTGKAIYASHGRGIMLSLLYFDSVEYEGLGNVVRLVKRL